MSSPPTRRYLFLCHTPYVRGGSMYAMTQLVCALGRAGNAVTVVTPVPPETRGRPAAPLLDAGLDVVEYPMPAVGGVFLGYRSELNPPGLTFEDYVAEQARHAVPLLEAAVERRRPDLIVLGHELFVWKILDRIRPWGIPVAVLAHGPLAGVVNGEMSEEFVDPLLGHLRRADLVMPVARYVARFACRNGVRARTLHNIVRTRKFAPGVPDPALRRALGVDPDDIVVLHASTLRLVKRPLDIVDAAALALKREPRLVFVIAGDGPLGPEMEARAQALGIAQRFRFTGWIPHGDMPDHVRFADMALLPSASEGMPYAALEALACAKPVVASDIAWTQEVMEEGEPMLLFPVGDVAAQADRIVKAAQDPTLRLRLGAAGRAYVEKHHHHEGVVRAFAAATATLSASDDDRQRAVP